MRSVSVAINTTGANGSASGTGQVGAGGEPSTVQAIVLDYAAGAPPTTTVTVTNQGRTIFTQTGNTSRLFPVLEQAYDQTGVAISGTGQKYIATTLHGTASIAVGSSNALTPAVTVVLILDGD